MMEELRAIIDPNEQILYEGKPNKLCYFLESVFNPLLPIAIIWAVIDFGIMGNAFLAQNVGGMSFFMVPFMLLHLMPVWLYLGGVLFSARKYRNTAYIVTDRAIYVSGGIFTRNINAKPFAELSHINLHRGIFDQMFNVGDIIATTNQVDQKGKTVTVNISSVSEYTTVYNLVKKLQTDIYTDVMYPNAKRPKENPGYNTEYRGL